jgi:hypothetical protein
MSKLSLFSNASDLRKQQVKLYNNNFTDCSFAFEFIAMNTSTTYKAEPRFEQIVNNVGFADVDAVGILNVSAANFSRLFYIKTNDLEFITGTPFGVTNTSYGVIGSPDIGVSDGIIPFKTFPTNLSYAYSQIRGGFANPALDFKDNTFLYQDYVRYTAKSITGGYALSDIFSNEQELLNGVSNMDPSFNENLTNLLLNASTCENVSANISTGMPHYNFVISCKTLVDSLLQDATNANQDNASSYLRGKQFLKDLQIQSKVQEDENFQNLDLSINPDGSNASLVNFSGFSTKKYWVIFHPGDVMAVRLNYNPKNGSGNRASNASGDLGGNPIYNRSYKIYLNMK